MSQSSSRRYSSYSRACQAESQDRIQRSSACIPVERDERRAGEFGNLPTMMTLGFLGVCFSDDIGRWIYWRCCTTVSRSFRGRSKGSNNFSKRFFNMVDLLSNRLVPLNTLIDRRQAGDRVIQLEDHVIITVDAICVIDLD